MPNHIHLLIHSELSNASRAMKLALGSYATFFNTKYDHVGHLFQGRFASKPVIDDAQLIAAICYIHMNPEKAGICSHDAYPWSSYREYIGQCEYSTSNDMIEAFGGIDGFIRYHNDYDISQDKPTLRKVRNVLSDKRARELAEEILGRSNLYKASALDKSERDRALVKLKDAGLSVRQIERLTGIGRNIIQRAR